jgi:hypothetical protein
LDDDDSVVVVDIGLRTSDADPERRVLSPVIVAMGDALPLAPGPYSMITRLPKGGRSLSRRGVERQRSL